MDENIYASKSDKLIIDSYNRFLSIRVTASETGYSWNKVVKALASNGYVLSETHAEILNKYENGMSIKRIAEEIGLNEKTVQSYIPRKRPIYNETPSDNALKIKKCRERKLGLND